MLSAVSRRGEPDIIGSGELRHAVERAFAHLHSLKRLAVRRERHLDLHGAFASLA